MKWYLVIDELILTSALASKVDLNVFLLILLSIFEAGNRVLYTINECLKGYDNYSATPVNP